MGGETIACPSPVWVVGTYDHNGQPNVMTASWAGICCGKPPAIAISLRRETYSYQSIVDSKAFTINVPSTKFSKEADFIGIASGKDTDKFKETGLTPVKSDKVHAPYVLEFPLILECSLIHTYEIGLHTQFIGEIIDTLADAKVISKDKKVSMKKIDPFLYSAPDRKYYAMGSFIGNAFSIGKSLS